MKSIFFVFIFLLTTWNSPAQVVLVPQTSSSKIAFAIKNFGLTTKGSLGGLQGSIRFDPQHLDQSKFDISLDAQTIFTDNKTRDNHLRKPDYFDVVAHPKIQFTSTKITASNVVNEYLLEGLFTLKGKTKKISFPFSATPEKNGFRFKGSFGLNRRDFGVGGNSLSLSDFVEANLDVLAQ